MEHLEYSTVPTARVKRKLSVRVFCWAAFVIAALLAAVVLMYMWLLGNTRINFYGRVVDDSGSPIADVQVFVRIYKQTGIMQGPWHPPASTLIKTELMTDQSGRFMVRGQYGRTLHVSFKKDKFLYVSPPRTTHWDYSKTPPNQLPNTPAKEATFKVKRDIEFGP